MEGSFYGPTIFLSESTGLHEGDFSVSFQVFLVSYQHDHNVGAGQCSCISQPIGQGIVRLSTNQHNNNNM